MSTSQSLSIKSINPYITWGLRHSSIHQLNSPLKYRPKPVVLSLISLWLSPPLLVLQLKPTTLTSSSPKQPACSVSHSRLVVIGCPFLLCTDMSQNLISSQMNSRIIQVRLCVGEAGSTASWRPLGTITNVNYHTTTRAVTLLLRCCCCSPSALSLMAYGDPQISCKITSLHCLLW